MQIMQQHNLKQKSDLICKSFGSSRWNSQATQVLYVANPYFPQYMCSLFFTLGFYRLGRRYTRFVATFFNCFPLQLINNRSDFLNMIRSNIVTQSLKLLIRSYFLYCTYYYFKYENPKQHKKRIDRKKQSRYRNRQEIRHRVSNRSFILTKKIWI